MVVVDAAEGKVGVVVEIAVVMVVVAGQLLWTLVLTFSACCRVQWAAAAAVVMTRSTLTTTTMTTKVRIIFSFYLIALHPYHVPTHLTASPSTIHHPPHCATGVAELELQQHKRGYYLEKFKLGEDVPEGFAADLCKRCVCTSARAHQPRDDC